jgi:hypothetical protein
MRWRDKIDELRAATQAALPALTRSGGIPPLDRFAGAGLRIGSAPPTSSWVRSCRPGRDCFPTKW